MIVLIAVATLIWATRAQPGPLRADGTGFAPLDSFQECDACPEMIVMPMRHFMMEAIPGESRDPFDIYGPA